VKMLTPLKDAYPKALRTLNEARLLRCVTAVIGREFNRTI
jgi:hypothetical protein